MITASKYIREHGFKSVQEFADFTGVPRVTFLNRWNNDKKNKSCRMLVTGAEVWKKEADSEKEICPECNNREYYQKYPDCINCESWDRCGAELKEFCIVPSVCHVCNGWHLKGGK